MSAHTVRVEISAPPEIVFDFLTDIPRMADWSPEVTRCHWVRGARGPVAGAQFRGWSRKGWRTWSTLSTVVAADRPTVFEWRVRFVGRPVATWRYTFDASGSTRTTVAETVVDQRGPMLRRLSPLITGSPDREARNDDTMNVTLNRLKAAAESAAGKR